VPPAKPITGRELLDLGDPVRVAVVDRRIGTGIEAGLHLGCAAGGRDHARAHQLAELHRGAADAAGTGVDQQRLAGLQVAGMAQCEQRGREVASQRERGTGRRARVERPGRVLRRHRVVGEAALLAGTRDARADRERAVAADDGADDLGTGRERQRRLDLVLATHDQRVAEGQAGGLDAHQVLVGSRRGHRDLALLQRAGFA
jgi:hypothetical protein